MKKRILSVFLALIMFVGLVPIITTSVNAAFSNDWTTWSQGGFGLTYKATQNDGTYAFARNGCHFMAHCKLMAEAGMSIDPDAYCQWVVDKNTDDCIYVYGRQDNGTFAVGEKSHGKSMMEYAKTRGVTIKQYKIISLTNLSEEQRIAKILELLNDGCYVTLDGNNTGESLYHETYIMRNKSLQTNSVWISDSSHTKSEGPITYEFLGKMSLGSKKDENGKYVKKYATKITAYAYKVSGSSDPTPTPTPSTSWKDTVQFIRPTAQNVTATNAKLSVTVSFSGDRAAEVGVDIGTSETQLDYVSHDINGGNWKNPQSFSYDLSSKGKTLEPGRTYYYRFYAKRTAGSTNSDEVVHSGTYSFTTSGNTSNFSISFKDITNNSEIKGTTAILRTQISYSGTAPQEVGFDFGTSPDNLTYRRCDVQRSGWRNGQEFHYDTKRYVGQLQPNTTYYYWFYAKSEEGTTDSNKVVHSNVFSFKTAASDSAGSGQVLFRDYSVTGITDTCAMPYVPYSFTGNRPTELGIYYGTDRTCLSAWPETTRFAATRGAAKSGTDGTITYNLSGLSSGTVYYFQTYAIQDGVEVRSDTGSFTTKGVSEISFENVKADSITTTNANISAKINYPIGNMPTHVGVEFGTSSSALTMVMEDSTATATGKYGYLLMTDSANKYGYTLTPGTTYYYRIYARYGASYAYDSVHSFTTVSETQGITFQDVTCAEVSSTNAIIKMRTNYPIGNMPSHVGFELGTSESSLTMVMEDSTASASGKYGYLLSTDSVNKYGYTLSPGTTYYYRAYARYDSTYFYDTIRSFTTLSNIPNISFENVYCTDITASNAVIKARTNYPIGNMPSHVGFELGTSESSLTMVMEDSTATASGKYGYLLSTDSANKYGHVLNPGTTYYYRAYARYDSVYIYDCVYSFTTSTEVPNVEFQNVCCSEVTETNAILTMRTNHPIGNMPSHVGFELGTSASSLTMVLEDSTASASGKYGYLLSTDSVNNYGHFLCPGTTYYYRAYARYGTSYIYDVVYSFTTPGTHAHSYTSETKSPTCTEDGYTIYTCSSCGYSYTVDLYQTGHSWGEWETWAYPTCDTAGMMARACRNDPSHVETKETEALGHKWGEWEIWAYPTCDSTGIRVRTCENDPNHTETEEIAALEHQWSDWETVMPATCVGDGIETRTCAHDISHYETRSIPAVGHQDIEIVTEPTCTEQGYTTYTCSVCGDSYIDAASYIPAHGHEYVGSGTLPSCENDWEETFTCTYCGDSYSTTLPPVGHDYVDGVCTRCGATETVLSGTCGENLTWTLDMQSGVLTISGQGTMDDFTDRAPAPWKQYNTTIQSVVVENGVTNIGERAFYTLKVLTNVTLPDSVTSIGVFAFNGCRSLESIVIPDSVTSIGKNAFAGCFNLTSVKLSSNLTSIVSLAFNSCQGLTSITIPENVVTIEEQAFFNCTNLKVVFIPNSVKTIENKAFYQCDSITDVYFNGYKSEWDKLAIADYNLPLVTATKHFTDVAQAEIKQPVISGTTVTAAVTCEEGVTAEALCVFYENGTFVSVQIVTLHSGDNELTFTGYNPSLTAKLFVIDSDKTTPLCESVTAK